MTDSEILDYLWHCARTGTDRQDKPVLHEFVRWPAHQPKTRLSVLGFKEPVFWPVQSMVAPYHVDGFLERFPTKYAVMLRHPYDVIASGSRRAVDTATWPGFTVDEHATLWVSSLLLWQRYRERGYPTLTVRWERLLLEYGTVRDELRDFLGLALPPAPTPMAVSPESAAIRLLLAEALPGAGGPAAVAGHRGRRPRRQPGPHGRPARWRAA